MRPAVREFITARGYRAATAKPPLGTRVEDELLLPEIVRLHGENYGI